MKPHLRHQARALAIQTIYAWQIQPLPIEELFTRFRKEANKKFDENYFERLVTLIIEQDDLLKNLITPHLDREFTKVNQVELAILRVGTCELKFFLDVPYPVILNEAIELTKKFSAENSHKFINGVLDKLIPLIREAEHLKLSTKNKNKASNKKDE